MQRLLPQGGGIVDATLPGEHGASTHTGVPLTSDPRRLLALALAARFSRRPSGCAGGPRETSALDSRCVLVLCGRARGRRTRRLAWRSRSTAATHASRRPRARTGAPRRWLPGDPARSLLALDDDLALRRAVRVVPRRRHDRPRLRQRRHPHDASARAPRSRLADVAAHGSPGATRRRRATCSACSSRGRPRDRRHRRPTIAPLSVRGRGPARSRRTSPRSTTWSLLLRRTRATATRQGPGNGSGALGPRPPRRRGRARRAGGTDVLAVADLPHAVGALARARRARCRSPSSPSSHAARRARRTRRSGSRRPAAASRRSLRLVAAARVVAPRARRGSARLAQHASASRSRTESQVFFVVDVSRSMAAAASPSGRRAAGAGPRRRRPAPRRRARRARRLAGLTDRVLPYLFPTLDEQAFSTRRRAAPS